jgi:hypothetical protein
VTVRRIQNSAEHRDKVLRYYRLAERARANTLVGGGVPALGAELDGREGAQHSLDFYTKSTNVCVQL